MKRPSLWHRLAVTAALLCSLLAAGVSTTLAQSPEQRGGDKVELKDVFGLLDAKTPEEEIRRKLGATVFVISAKDERELARRGASDELIEFMKQLRGEKNPEITDFAIVLDCSRSMLEPTREGTTKMQAAKEAVSDLVRKLPADLKVALIIYGHRQQNPCTAVEVLRPIGVLGEDGRASLLEKLNQLDGVGATPIALALEAAGRELAKNKAPCGLVLISDGKESCKGDPSAEAAKLAQQLPITFGVNVVGFDVKDDERQALEEIAQSGKGKYYGTNSTDELAAALGKLATQIPEPAPAPKVTSGRRAVKVLSPKVALPKLNRIVLSKTGAAVPRYLDDYARDYVVGQTNKYDADIRVPSTEKYDLWWQAENGTAVKMVADISIEKRETVEIRPESHLGMLRLGGDGLPKPKEIVLAVAQAVNLDEHNRVQTARKLGDVLVAPAGKYDLWLVPVEGAPMLIESELEIEPGKLVELD